METQIPDWRRIMGENLDQYLRFMAQIGELGRLALDCPEGVHLSRLEVAAASIGQWRGVPESVKLWFSTFGDDAKGPTIKPEVEAKFRSIFNNLASKYMVLRYEIGFRLEGRPGYIVNSVGKEVFTPDTPGMTMTVVINKE